MPDNIGTLIDQTDIIVIKSHKPSQSLVNFVRFCGGVIILTARDPRDCVTSLNEVFSYSKKEAIKTIKESAHVLDRIGADLPCLVFRFEDVEDEVEIARRIAEFLSISVQADRLSALASELSPAALQAHLRTLEDEGKLDPANATQSWTEESHWHPGHVGDGAIGKYRTFLSKLESYHVGQEISGFMQRFGYALDPLPPICGNSTLVFSDYASAYAAEGLSIPEDWGIWTDGYTARIILPFAAETKSVQLSFPIMMGPSFVDGRDGSGTLLINNRAVLELPYYDAPCPEFIVIHSAAPQADHTMSIEFRFRNLQTPEYYGINLDKRLLGVGLRFLRVRTS